MSKYPAVTYKDVIKVAKELGFELKSHNATSHMQYRHPGTGRKLTISSHNKKNFGPDLLSWTLKQMAISKKEFFEKLQAK